MLTQGHVTQMRDQQVWHVEACLKHEELMLFAITPGWISRDGYHSWPAKVEAPRTRKALDVAATLLPAALIDTDGQMSRRARAGVLRRSCRKYF